MGEQKNKSNKTNLLKSTQLNSPLVNTVQQHDTRHEQEKQSYSTQLNTTQQLNKKRINLSSQKG